MHGEKTPPVLQPKRAALQCLARGLRSVRIVLAILVVSASLAPAAAPQGSVGRATAPRSFLYGVNAAGDLIAIDPSGFVERKIGPIGTSKANALAYDNRSDTLYGLTPEGTLLAIDRRTGRGELIQKLSPPGRPLFSSLAFESTPGGGRLYAANAGEGRELFRIDLGRTPPYPVVRLGSTQDRGQPAQVTGLAMQPGTGRLYAIQRNRNALGTLAAAVGAFAAVFPNCGINNPEGLAFDPATGVLYGLFSPGALGIYDLATGRATAVGRTSSATALAGAPPPITPLTMAQRYPAPGENLKAYKERMEKYFDPQIARRGLAALAKEEAGEYADYLRFLRRWEPRLPDGDFAAYFERERNYYRRREVSPRGPLPAPRASKSALTARALSTASAPLWQEVGPISIPITHVGAEGTGPIAFITFYNLSPSRMLAGSDEGGLFYTTNGGVTWSPTGTDTQIGPSGVNSAVFHPGDYKTWFASSSGNGNINNPSSIGWIGGVFRTTDEGATWKLIGDQAQLGGIWARIFKLAINPANPNQLWAATSVGLFATVNALAATPVWSAAPALAGKDVEDFEIRSGDANWLYATVADWSGANLVNRRFEYSKDNGNTWQPVPGQPASTAGASALTIEVSPAKADNLYCVTIPPGGYPSELSIYDFGTNQWHLVYGLANIRAGGGHAFGVDRVDPNVIYLSEGTEGRRYTYQGNPLWVDYLSTYSGGTYHPDIEHLVPHPLNVNEVWMSHHGGVSVSFDGGLTWTDRSTGLGAAQVFGMAAGASDPSYVALGLDHTGTIVTDSLWSNLWSPTWKEFPNSFCDGMLPMIDPTTPQYMWEACQWGAWNASTDKGLTFNPNGPDSPAWVVGAAFNHLDPKTQYRLGLDGGGFTTVQRTFDRGNTWAQIAAFQALYPAATHDYILWKVYTPETNGDYLVVHLLERPTGTQWWIHNHLYRTKIANDPSPANVIASWEDLPLADNRWISDLRFEPANPDVVYIANSSSSSSSSSLTGSAMVFKVDYTNPAAHTAGTCTPGLCWDLTQNLPNATTGQNDLAVEQGSNDRIYFATDFGLWTSTKATRALGGSGWALWGSGLPNTNYNGLEINYVNNKLRAAANGRGLWEADLPSGCTEPPPTPALWLPLDEAAGPTALNAASAVSGTHAGGPTPLAAGKVAGALCFDGLDDRVDVPVYAAISFATLSFSLDTWVLRQPGGGNTQVLIDKRKDSGSQLWGYSLFLFFGQIGLQLADGTFANYLSSAQVPADGLWHHVAVTVDRGNPAGGRFYLDGQPAGPPFNPTAHAGSLNAAAPFRIGARSALTSSGPVSAVLRGCLDEVEAFRRVLSPDEVLAIYRAGANGKCKRGCDLPSLARFCGTASTVTVFARICNYQSTPQVFTYSVLGLPVQSGCSIPGPANFTPASGAITVPPVKCTTVPISIAKPTAMTGAGMTACYSLLVQTSTGETFSAGGTLDAMDSCDRLPDGSGQ
jgi:Concanavalin A-like lectin/glucanases superfamily